MSDATADRDETVDAPVPLTAVPQPAPERPQPPGTVPGSDAGAPAPTASASETAAAAAGLSAAAFTDEAMLRPSHPAPRAGWRRAVHRLTGGRVKPGPSPREAAAAALARRVRQPLAGSHRVAVISRKGGVGKTSVTLLLGHTLATHRGDRVVAIDGNPDAGSLGHRVPRETAATVTDLLAAGDALGRYHDVRRFTSQAASRLEVVASDDDPAVTRALDDSDYRTAIEALDRHYSLIVADTGTGILDAATQGILAAADQLVVVATASLDGARAAAATLDWLDVHGHAPLTAGAVAVINRVRPDDRGPVNVDAVDKHLAARCRAVVAMPFDPALAAGAQVDLATLRPATRAACLQLAAAVADGFADPPPKRAAARGPSLVPQAGRSLT